MSQQKSPRSVAALPKAKIQKASNKTHITPCEESQGLLISLDRLVSSKHRLLTSRDERQELQEVLSALQDPKAVRHIAKNERLLKATQRRLSDVNLAISGTMAALQRLEGGVACQ